MSIHTVNKTEGIDTTQLAIWQAEQQFGQIIGALQSANAQTEYAWILLAQSCAEIGDYETGADACQRGLTEYPGQAELVRLQSVFADLKAQQEQAMSEIAAGQHASDAINQWKQYIKTMIEQGLYESALRQLHRFAEARQIKTTNILWIGNYLKDVYFAKEAQYLLPRFERMLLEEMLFYYLKACKLFDPGYSVVKEAVKRLG